MRVAIDTGGTFTDLVVEVASGQYRMFKASTTPEDPIEGILNALRLAAREHEKSLEVFLGGVTQFIYGTTHPINAVLTGNVAKTAFFTTEGHPDVLTLREGGRPDAFDFSRASPKPYIPRALTWEVPGRIAASGSELAPLDAASVVRSIESAVERGVEAVAVCLLWSIINPAHELQVGELLKKHAPNLPFTLSHQLNPALREYRRASSAAINASLQPMMTRFLQSLETKLRAAGLGGRLDVITSQGGLVDAREAQSTPIHLLNSGPSMAPVAGRFFTSEVGASATAIVADTGGTTYDVSLVSDNTIPWTREMWVGEPYYGHMTGFPSIDVKSIGAGGGSIAWVDDGGMLRIGPQSAGSRPGPVCYSRGGTQPTVTDAAVVLGYVDAQFFLGGTMKLDLHAARLAMQRYVADPLGISVNDAAYAVLEVATENMAQAIEDLTVNQGIDPRKCQLIGGGGAAGLNSVAIAQRLKCPTLLIPQFGAAMSATGALLSNLSAFFQTTRFQSVRGFQSDVVSAVLHELTSKAMAFASANGATREQSTLSYSVEARYADQIWEIPLPFRPDNAGHVSADSLAQSFHREHTRIFGYEDAGSDIEFITWSVKVDCATYAQPKGRSFATYLDPVKPSSRSIYFRDVGEVVAPVYLFEALTGEEHIVGPAIVESSFTSIVINPHATARRDKAGSLEITIDNSAGEKA